MVTTTTCGAGLVPESSTIMLVPGKTRDRDGAAGWRGHHGELEGGFVGFFVCLSLVKLLGMLGTGIWARGIHPWT